jgi:hypothetical protein
MIQAIHKLLNLRISIERLNFFKLNTFQLYSKSLKTIRTLSKPRQIDERLEAGAFSP